MKRPLTVLLFALLSCSVNLAFADDPPGLSYDYIHLEYSISNYLDGASNATLGISMELSDRFHAVSSLVLTELDAAPGIDVENTGYGLALGVKQRFGTNKVMHLRGGYVGNDSTITVTPFGVVGGERDHGYYVELGWRVMPNPDWEVGAYAIKIDFGHVELHQMLFSLERRLSRKMSLNLNGIWTDGDGESLGLGVRYHF